MKQLLHQLDRYQYILATLVIAGLLCYTAYSASQVINIAPDRDYLAAQKDQQATAGIKINKKTVSAISSLEQVNNTIPIHTGKTDPFSQ